MTIRCLPLGALQANCYLLSDEEGATRCGWFRKTGILH